MSEAYPGLQSNSDDAFDAAVDAFIVELESNPQLDPQQLVVAFPDRKSEILRLFADVRREPSPAELQDLPPLPGQYSVIAPRTLLEQVQGGPNSPAAVGKHALPPSGAAVIQLPQQLGAYTLVERIGSGGMGEVYRAVQEQPIVREVAVKIVKPETGGRELLARFDNERRSLARMHHPNIAIVIDGGATEDERPYLVMELVRGVSITEYCSTHELGLRQRLKLLLKVCAGIQHAHQKSIIHRDIKPSNVLVTEVDHVPIPKVIDFGLAKVMADEQGSDDSFQSSHTLLGQILGTLQYMSPEQASLQNDRIDTRSDVFALGILLFELVTGTTPLAGQLGSEVPIDERLRSVRQQVPIRPSERVRELARENVRQLDVPRASSSSTITSSQASQLRGDLDAICMKALASDPAQRYESAAAFAEDIERFLDNRPVFASQPSELSILLKYAYRHRVAVGTICAIAVMLLVAVVVSTLLAIKATRAEQLAEGRSTLLAEARLRAESSLYISQMNLVQQAIRQGDLQQARGYLTRHIPEADEPDLRGFEWYYWNHHLKNYLGEVDAEQEIFSVLLAPSGKFIVCCGMGRVQFWDPQTHQLIRELHVSDEMMTGMALTRDERRLATGGKNGQVAMWDLQHNDAQVFAVEFDDPIRALALDSSGKLLFAGGVSGTVRVLDAETGTLLSEFAAHEHNVYSLDVAPDDRLLASGGGDNLAKVWQFDATGQLKLDAVQTLKEHSAAVRSVKFSPDSRLLASGSYDSRTNIWEVETGQRLHRLRGHSEEVYQAAFSPDGKTLATCSRDETIKLWDVANGFEKETLVGHRFTVYSVAYSTDGQQLVSGAFDKTLKFWDVSSAREPLVFYDHEKAIRNIAYSPDSKWLASVGDDGTIVVRTLHGKLIQQLHPARESIDSVAFLPAQDGQLTVQSRLLTGYSDGVIQVYNLPSGEPILEIEAHADRVFSIQVAPGAKQFASAGDRCVKMWDATNLQLQQQLDLSEFQSAVAYSPDGKMLAAVGENGALVIWDLPACTRRTTIVGQPERLYAVCFSPDSQFLAYGGRGRKVYLYDVHREAQVQEFTGHSSTVHSIQFADKRTLVTGGTDMQIKFWDINSGEVKTSLEGHTLPIIDMRMSPNGNVLATADGRGAIRMWYGHD